MVVVNLPGCKFLISLKLGACLRIEFIAIQCIRENTKLYQLSYHKAEESIDFENNLCCGH